MSGLDRPVFVVGVPRSGTTLVSSILSAHPGLFIAQETHFLDEWIDQLPCREECGQESLLRLASHVVSDPRFGRPEADRERIQRRVAAEGARTPRDVLTICLDEVRRSEGKARVGEKTPDHDDHVETLLDWFPDARIVWLVRDPRALLASIRRVPWPYVSNPRGMAGRWRRSVERLERLSRYDARVLPVRYEDLVREAEAEVRRILAFLGERFHPSMLGGDRPAHYHPESGWSEAHATRARQAVDARSTDVWKDELDGPDVALLELEAGGALGRWRYRRSATAGDLARLAGRALAKVIRDR